jgi:hypothetical protein
MVPRINLADPDIEPTDEELRSLSWAARDTAIARHLHVEASSRAEMRGNLRASRASAARLIQ